MLDRIADTLNATLYATLAAFGTYLFLCLLPLAFIASPEIVAQWANYPAVYGVALVSGICFGAIRFYLLRDDRFPRVPSTDLNWEPASRAICCHLEPYALLTAKRRRLDAMCRIGRDGAIRFVLPDGTRIPLGDVVAIARLN